ncbi:MAG: hypothetical protein WKF35_05195 [Ferruginibacter sp.]
MDIENVWQQGKGSDDALNKVLQISDFDIIHSKSPLKQLRKNLLIGIVWAVIITIFYVGLLFFISIWQVNIALFILIFFNSLIAFDSWKLYKNIHINNLATHSLKDELQKNYSGFRKWWRVQERSCLFVYPIAITGGFILGGYLGSEKPIAEFLYNPRMLSILGIANLILVPLSYFGARWMFKYAYGKHLEKLQSLIEELA